MAVVSTRLLPAIVSSPTGVSLGGGLRAVVVVFPEPPADVEVFSRRAAAPCGPPLPELRDIGLLLAGGSDGQLNLQSNMPTLIRSPFFNSRRLFELLVVDERAVRAAEVFDRCRIPSIRMAQCFRLTRLLWGRR